MQVTVKSLSRAQRFAAPGTVTHGIFQASVLEWVAIPFSRGSSWPRDQTRVSHIADRGFTSEPPGEVMNYDWFMLLYGRNHNNVKQLSSNKKRKVMKNIYVL